jgi:hypothetical protein
MRTIWLFRRTLAALALAIAFPATAMGQVTGFCFGEVCVGTEAVAYLGDFCWTFAAGEGEGLLTLGVTHMGGKRFALNGTIEMQDGQFPITGVATRRGREWFIAMTATGGGVGFAIPTDPPQVVDVAGAALFYAVLDGPSLNGQLLSARVLGFAQEREGNASGVRFAGAVELSSITCE